MIKYNKVRLDIIIKKNRGKFRKNLLKLNYCKIYKIILSKNFILKTQQKSILYIKKKKK